IECVVLCQSGISRYVTRPIGALTGAVEAVCAATTQTRPTLPASREEQGTQISNEKCQSALTDWHYAIWRALSLRGDAGLKNLFTICCAS
ncbi:hypothetical protein, partial [Chromobacterium haemolyticum]|uniref:hypothetical protein n=1 Tax=Chromobacterium haemolyticum TaxID=394935 RepID=UPI001C38B1D4